MLYVDACYSLLNYVEDSHENLLGLVRELMGEKPRRMDRFTLLALAGALQCGNRKDVHSEAGIVLATAVGTLSTAVDMMAKIVIEKQPPKPFQFVNSLGNSACYSLARLFGIKGPSLAVSHELASFESGLYHAELILNDKSNAQHIPQIMLGGLDEVPLPISDNLKRHHVKSSDYKACYDGTHWLRVSTKVNSNSFASIKSLGEYSLAGDFVEVVGMVMQENNLHFNSTPIFRNVYVSNELAGEQPEQKVLPHGSFSGHCFVKACEYVRKAKSEKESSVAHALVATVDTKKSKLTVSLVSAV